MTAPIRLEALETLDAIDRHGSFAAAAAALYRVPSAVSYTVAQLESDLGLAVFDRSGHRAVLTPAGRLLLAEGRRILEASRELGAAARRLADNWEPELRIAVDGLIAPSTLWPHIEAFHAAHPEIDVRLSDEILGGTWEALIDNRVEVAVGLAEPPANASLRRAPFTPVPVVFCCAPDHPLAGVDAPLADADVRGHRAVIVADSARHLSPRSAGLLDGQPRLTVTSMYRKIDALERGLGVGYCPAEWVKTAIDAGRLITRTMAVPREPIPAYLMWRTGRCGRAQQWFVDRLTGAAAS